jgi:hypothetical protein
LHGAPVGDMVLARMDKKENLFTGNQGKSGLIPIVQWRKPLFGLSAVKDRLAQRRITPRSRSPLRCTAFCFGARSLHSRRNISLRSIYSARAVRRANFTSRNFGYASTLAEIRRSTIGDHRGNTRFPIYLSAHTESSL